MDTMRTMRTHVTHTYTIYDEMKKTIDGICVYIDIHMCIQMYIHSFSPISVEIFFLDRHDHKNEPFAKNHFGQVF